MANEIITTLHPYNDDNTDLYPNIKKENIPLNSISFDLLNDDVKNYINSLENSSPKGVYSTLTQLQNAYPNGTSGIFVVQDTGYWYFWNGTAWTSGGVYQATMLSDGSIPFEKTDFINGIINILDFDDPTNIIKSGYFGTNLNYPNGTANSQYAFVRCAVQPNTTYTIKAWFYFAELDNNETFIRQTNLGQSNLIEYTFTTQATTNYILFNTTPSALYTSMVLRGSSYQSEYYPYGEYYKFKGVQVYALKSEVLGAEIYYVGTGETYTTFTSCIRALRTNTNKKIIYVKEGTYDIFNEIGGSAYALSIASGTSWVDCNDIIPDNTTIIGLGDVIFNFTPTGAEIGNIADKLLSPINVQGNVTIENITINADNCRYCIHDESGDAYANSVKNYKNVKCYKYKTDGKGLNQAFASGFYKGITYNFENCYFYSVAIGISFHDRNYNGGNININNCAIISNETLPTLVFGNVAYSQKHHKVYINNTYISNKIYIQAENGNETINSFDLQVIGCNDPTIDIQSVLTTNIYTPKVYN